MRKFLLTILLILTAMTGTAQSVTAPTANSYNQNTSNQSAAGFSVTGFVPTTSLLVTVGLVNPPSGATLRFSATAGVEELPDAY